MSAAEVRHIRSSPKETSLTPEEIRQVASAVASEFASTMNSEEYAHAALRDVIVAETEADMTRQQNRLRGAQVFALLSLRDAVVEATATLKHIANQPQEDK